MIHCRGRPLIDLVPDCLLNLFQALSCSRFSLHFLRAQVKALLVNVNELHSNLQRCRVKILVLLASFEDAIPILFNFFLFHKIQSLLQKFLLGRDEGHVRVLVDDLSKCKISFGLETALEGARVWPTLVKLLE